VVEIGWTDSDRDLGPVDNVRVRVVRAFCHEDRNAASVDSLEESV
jgi:hypothetical protein